MTKVKYGIFVIVSSTLAVILGILIGKNICQNQKNQNQAVIIPYKCEQSEEKNIENVSNKDTTKAKGYRDEVTEKCAHSTSAKEYETTFDQLPDFIKNNEVVINILKNDCLFPMQTAYFDVTGDNKKDILMLTEAYNCITCRNTRLIIISDNKVIVDKSVNDAIIRRVENSDTSFELKEPIHLHLDGYCCPKKGIVKVYEYWGENFTDSDGTPYFARVDEYTENYHTEGFTTSNERRNTYK